MMIQFKNTRNDNANNPSTNDDLGTSEMISSNYNNPLCFVTGSSNNLDILSQSQMFKAHDWDSFLKAQLKKIWIGRSQSFWLPQDSITPEWLQINKHNLVILTQMTSGWVAKSLICLGWLLEAGLALPAAIKTGIPLPLRPSRTTRLIVFCT